jgi:hypothetical protein
MAWAEKTRYRAGHEKHAALACPLGIAISPHDYKRAGNRTWPDGFKDLTAC